MPSLATIETKLRKLALAYPGAVEEYPWGDRVYKVVKKIFVFINVRDQQLWVTTKLPESSSIALSLPFTRPTAYGLGKAGWVTSTFAKAKDVPVDLLVSWIEESYRAIAPKKLIKELDAG